MTHTQLQQIINPKKDMNIDELVDKTYKIGHGLGFWKGVIITGTIITATLLAIPYLSKNEAIKHYQIRKMPEYKIEQKKPANINELFPPMHVYNFENKAKNQYINKT